MGENVVSGVASGRICTPRVQPTRLCDRMDKARGLYTPHLDAVAVKPVTEWVWRPGFGWVEREVTA